MLDLRTRRALVGLLDVRTERTWAELDLADLVDLQSAGFAGA